MGNVGAVLNRCLILHASRFTLPGYLGYLLALRSPARGGIGGGMFDLYDPLEANPQCDSVFWPLALMACCPSIPCFMDGSASGKSIDIIGEL